MTHHREAKVRYVDPGWHYGRGISGIACGAGKGTHGEGRERGGRRKRGRGGHTRGGEGGKKGKKG